MPLCPPSGPACAAELDASPPTPPARRGASLSSIGGESQSSAADPTGEELVAEGSLRTAPPEERAGGGCCGGWKGSGARAGSFPAAGRCSSAARRSNGSVGTVPPPPELPPSGSEEGGSPGWAAASPLSACIQQPMPALSAKIRRASAARSSWPLLMMGVSAQTRSLHLALVPSSGWSTRTSHQVRPGEVQPRNSWKSPAPIRASTHGTRGPRGPFSRLCAALLARVSARNCCGRCTPGVAGDIGSTDDGAGATNASNSMQQGAGGASPKMAKCRALPSISSEL
mmetsp:Transcript_35012/g.104282  ORF Transcript_35012/g.104282 Transcript_35012/m.104282 type:complete len:284 (+) Transcript_35012:440-1291(+)